MKSTILLKSQLRFLFGLVLLSSVAASAGAQPTIETDANKHGPSSPFASYKGRVMCGYQPPSQFITYEGVPSDHYLWLTGKAAETLRGERPVDKELYKNTQH